MSGSSFRIATASHAAGHDQGALTRREAGPEVAAASGRPGPSQRRMPFRPSWRRGFFQMDAHAGRVLHQERISVP